MYGNIYFYGGRGRGSGGGRGGDRGRGRGRDGDENAPTPAAKKFTGSKYQIYLTQKTIGSNVLIIIFFRM